MSKLIAWVRSKHWSAHAIFLTIFGIASIITADQHVRDFVLVTFKRWPDIGTWVIAAAGIITVYKNFASQAGTVASAQVIMAAPNPPTQAEITAAKPEIKGV